MAYKKNHTNVFDDSFIIEITLSYIPHLFHISLFSLVGWGVLMTLPTIQTILVTILKVVFHISNALKLRLGLELGIGIG
jgi:hypothetical protein